MSNTPNVEVTGMRFARGVCMNNPNNCAACDHKRNPQGGWCYMFREEPEATCLQHTMRRGMTAAEVIQDLAAMRRRGQPWVRSEPPNVC